MKKSLLILLVAITGISTAQEVWHLDGTIGFPTADTSWARPYQCKIDKSGNLWITTTSSIDTACHNALFKAAPSINTFTKVYDFKVAEGDLFSAKGLVGLATMGTDVIIFSRVDNSYGHSFRFVKGRSDSIQNFSSGGYGTHMYGCAATKDSFVYSGISAWGISIRIHNFSSDAAEAALGAWVAFNSSDGSTAPKEPGGPTINGSALIRDVALTPNGNYNDTNTVFYTSRNSEEGILNGGIAVWKGGTQRKTIVNPEKYKGRRVIDLFADLAWGTSNPYGIDVDTLGRIWACGTDSTRRYVRIYEVDASSDPAVASMSFELPSKNSPNPDPAGADFMSPADVAVRGDIAYVTDPGKRVVFRFKKGATGVNPADGRLPATFVLNQNYPNPFNPATIISFDLAKSGHVTLSVYNILGQEIVTLIDSYKSAGHHSIVFNAGAHALPSGIYLYQLRTAGMTFTRKMMLAK